MKRGIRVWTYVSHNDYTLRSANFVPWTPGEVMVGNHLAPNPKGLGDSLKVLDQERVVHPGPRQYCVCGVWACKIGKGGKVVWSHVRAFQKFRNGHVVVGICDIWGKIIEHDRGYRAEFGYPERLFTFGPRAERVALNLSELYGVPAQPFNHKDWEAALRERS